MTTGEILANGSVSEIDTAARFMRTGTKVRANLSFAAKQIAKDVDPARPSISINERGARTMSARWSQGEDVPSLYTAW